MEFVRQVSHVDLRVRAFQRAHEAGKSKKGSRGVAESGFHQVISFSSGLLVGAEGLEPPTC